MRPIKYIQSKRIQRAQLLLSTTFDSLTEIAEKVGLDNMSYFIRTFKKFTEKHPVISEKKNSMCDKYLS